MPHSKYLKFEHYEDLIKKYDPLFIGEDGKLPIDNSPTDINTFVFLYNLQQRTMKNDSPDHFEFLKLLQIKEEKVINSNAKKPIKKKFSRSRNKKKSCYENTEKKGSNFQKPQKHDNQKQQQSNRALLIENIDKKEEVFETLYEATVEKEKQWECYE